MRPFAFTLCLATAALALGQPAIAPPQLGWVRDSGSGVRAVRGLASNFVLGEPVLDGVLSSAFSGPFGIIKTGAALLVFDQDGQVLARTDADAGPALLAFSNQGEPAFVYLTQSQTLFACKANRLQPLPFDAEMVKGTVLSIASPAPDKATLVVQRDDGLWLIDLALGTQNLISGVVGPVLLRNDGSLLYAQPQGLVLRQADSSELRFEAVVEVAGFEQMGKGWVHITERDSPRHFALRLEPGREQIFQLPEVQPPAEVNQSEVNQ